MESTQAAEARLIEAKAEADSLKPIADARAEARHSLAAPDEAGRGVVEIDEDGIRQRVEKIERKKVGGRGVEKVKEETVGGTLHWRRENGADLDWFRREIRKAHGGRAPRVRDPFAGGGAIPPEAMRLGCEASAMDINPVAWFILCQGGRRVEPPGGSCAWCSDRRRRHRGGEFPARRVRAKIALLLPSEPRSGMRT